jgi:hypothetical protein
MGGFYSSDKRIMGWLAGWISIGCGLPHMRQYDRDRLASQLRLIRKKHSTPLAGRFRDHIMWIGSYPTK